MSEPYRKKRNGREYGNWYAWIGGQVNLGTIDLEQAKARAREIAAQKGIEQKGEPTPAPRSPSSGEPAAAGSPFAAWAGAPPPLPREVAAAPVANDSPPTLSPAMLVLAEGVSEAAARLNVTLAELGVTKLAKVQTQPIDVERIKRLAGAYKPGVMELLQKSEFKWWWLLIIENVSLVGELVRRGTPLAVTSVASSPPQTETPNAQAA